MLFFSITICLPFPRCLQSDVTIGILACHGTIAASITPQDMQTDAHSHTHIYTYTLIHLCFYIFCCLENQTDVRLCAQARTHTLKYKCTYIYNKSTCTRINANTAREMSMCAHTHREINRTTHT